VEGKTSMKVTEEDNRGSETHATIDIEDEYTAIGATVESNLLTKSEAEWVDQRLAIE